jgi:hypothetical protein
LFTPTQQGPSESCDVGRFGGLAFEQTTGTLMRTVRWTPSNIVITGYVGGRPYASALVAKRKQAHVATISVGRIKFASTLSVALLSGWISANGNDRFFISSSHGFPVDGSVSTGTVCFSDLWEGESTFAGDDIHLFTVSFHSALSAAEILVWKFEAADLPQLPPPLSFAAKLKVNDPVFAAGYCVVPTQDKLTEYFNAINDPVKAHAFQPDVSAAFLAYHPNHKIISPGPVVAAGNKRGLEMFAVQGSMYHGMSGGPVIPLIGAAALGVSGQVIGNTETLTMNANTVLDITSDPVYSFLRNYM